MLKFFKIHWQETIVALLALGFFIGSSAFIQVNQSGSFVKWSSPDESANYFFAKLYAETGQLSVYEKHGPIVDDIIHPRSLRSDGGVMKPVSFLGIILIFGTIARYTSVAILPFLTPLFGALGIFFYYLLIRRAFNRKIAFISVVWLAFFPVYYYYTVRAFFHNILFVSLLIIGLYLIVLATSRADVKNRFFEWRFWKMNWTNLFLAALAGLVVGAALVSRTSEALWVLPLLFILWIFNIRRAGFLKPVLFVFLAAAAFVPMLGWNEILYGGFMNGGYTEMNRSLSTIAGAGAEAAKGLGQARIAIVREPLSVIMDNIFYFGFHPSQAFQTLKNYFAKMFPLLFWPAALGLILFLARTWKWRKKYWVYLLSWLVLSAILVLYYGSWLFHDNPDPREITIGNSYTRYWLPVYLGAMPLAAFFWLRLAWAVFARDREEQEISQFDVRPKDWRDFFRPAWPRREFLSGCLIAIFLIINAFLSAQFVFGGSKEGLVYALANNEEARREYAAVLRATGPSAVIITRYGDKLLFPERQVIVGDLLDAAMNERYARLARYRPVFYYSFAFSRADLDYLNSGKLAAAGLNLKKERTITDKFTLYRLERGWQPKEAVPGLKK